MLGSSLREVVGGSYPLIAYTTTFMENLQVSNSLVMVPDLMRLGGREVK